MAQPVVVVTFQPPAGCLDILAPLGNVVVEPDPKGWRTLARTASGLCCLLLDKLDGAFMDSCPGLKVIGTASVGVDHIDVAAASARGIWVCHTPGVLTEATADLTMTLILCVARRVMEGEALVREGRFHGWRHDMLLGLEMNGATLGIVGMGRIGQAVARRASGFGMRILWTDPTQTQRGELRGQRVDLEDLCRCSDVVSLHVPLNDSTHHLMDRARLRSLKQGALLINTSRGPVVDEAALAEALMDGHLGGAGLDVYEREPAVHPDLLKAPRTVLLPHLGSATEKTRRGMVERAFTDVRAILSGQKPTFPFNAQQREQAGCSR